MARRAINTIEVFFMVFFSPSEMSLKSGHNWPDNVRNGVQRPPSYTKYATKGRPQMTPAAGACAAILPTSMDSLPALRRHRLLAVFSPCSRRAPAC